MTEPDLGTCPKCGRTLSPAPDGGPLAHCPACGCPLRAGLTPRPTPNVTSERAPMDPHVAWLLRGLVFGGCCLAGMVIPILLPGGRDFDLSMARSRWGVIIGFAVGSALSSQIGRGKAGGSDKA